MKFQVIHAHPLSPKRLNLIKYIYALRITLIASKVIKRGLGWHLNEFADPTLNDQVHSNSGVA